MGGAAAGSIDGDTKFTPQNLNKILFSNHSALINMFRWCTRFVLPDFNSNCLCPCRDDGIPQL